MEMLNTDISEQNDLSEVLRDNVEMLSNRIWLLDEEERVIMRMYLDNGSSFRQLAKLTGANEATMGRRIHKIISRLSDNRFINCLRNRRDLSAFELKVARDFYIRGLSLRTISAKKAVSYYAVRKAIEHIKKIADRAYTATDVRRK